MSSTSLVQSEYSRDWGSYEPRRRGGFSRFVVAVGIGVGSTLAWQSYGDMVREKIAGAYPQLGWLAPGEAAAQTTSASPRLRSTDQQIQELSRGLAAMRDRVEQLSMQVSTSQDQLTRDIAARLQASEREILDKIATVQPRQDVTASARKPASQAQATH
jgi:hypothetical protein